MANKDWDSVPYTSADCVRDHVEWNAMVDYIKHSGSCDSGNGFKLFDDDDSSNELFRFYEHNIDFNDDRAIYINDDETYIGHGAGDNNAGGINNTFIGHDAGNANTTGNYNAGVGFEVLLHTNANEGTAVGSQALKENTSGIRNTAVGSSALRANTAGTLNTAVGSAALLDNIDGNKNVAIGRYASGTSTDKSSGVFIGFEAGKNNDTSNRLFINNSSSAYPLIYGEFDADVLSFGDNSAYFFAHITHENSGGQLFLKECTTPTAKANYGTIYFKADNKLYCQTGDGVEHEVTIS